MTLLFLSWYFFEMFEVYCKIRYLDTLQVLRVYTYYAPIQKQLY